MAAAALQRCCDLLDGVAVLIDADAGGVSGVLVRALFEAWLFGLHVLLAGDEALVEWAGDYRRNIQTLVNRNELDLQHVIDEWEVPAARVNVEDICRRVTQLLREGDDPNADVMTSYDLLYRSESTFNVHAGVGSVGRYIAYHSEYWGIEPSPKDIVPPDARPGLAALLVTHLAARLYERFGIDKAIIEDLYERLARLEGER